MTTSQSHKLQGNKFFFDGAAVELGQIPVTAVATGATTFVLRSTTPTRISVSVWTQISLATVSQTVTRSNGTVQTVVNLALRSVTVTRSNGTVQTVVNLALRSVTATRLTSLINTLISIQTRFFTKTHLQVGALPQDYVSSEFNVFLLNTATLNEQSNLRMALDTGNLQTIETVQLATLLSVLDSLSVGTVETQNLRVLLSTVDSLNVSVTELQQLLVNIFGADVLTLSSLEHAALLRVLLLPTRVNFIDTSLGVVILPTEPRTRLEKGGITVNV